jgi:hypothetical protein
MRALRRAQIVRTWRSIKQAKLFLPEVMRGAKRAQCFKFVGERAFLLFDMRAIRGDEL